MPTSDSGAFGGLENHKKLFEMLKTELDASVDEGVNIPEGAVMHYFVGETTPQFFSDQVKEANPQVDLIHLRTQLYNGIREWLTKARAEIEDHGRREYWNPSFLAKNKQL